MPPEEYRAASGDAASRPNQPATSTVTAIQVTAAWPPGDWQAKAGTGDPVVIDLGCDRGEPDGYAAPGRRTGPGWWAPLLVALFVLVASTASAAPPEPPLTRLLSVQVDGADSYALTDDGLLLLQSPGTGTLRAYDLGTGRLRWQATASAPTYGVRTGGGAILLRPRSFGPEEPGTFALSLATGAARWRRTGSVLTVAGSPVLLAVNQVRSVSGFGGRVSGQVDGVDPATGRTRWSVPVPSTAVPLGVPVPAGGPARLLLVHDSGTAQEHDLATGRPLARVELPPADYATDNPGFFAGTLMLRHPSRSGSMVSAYHPGTLRPRWSRPAGSTYRLQRCGRLACLIGRDGVRAVDPADGTDRWYRPDWRNVEQNGAASLAYAPSRLGDSDLVGSFDPDTGEVTVPLPRWRRVPVGSGAGNGRRVLVTRAAEEPGRTTVAVADTVTGRLRLLGELPVGNGDCRTLSSRLVCRSTGGELVVWGFR